MRISFVGKGGSGKTTVSSLFIQFLARNGSPVLAIDADINQHLRESIGLNGQPMKKLGHELDELKRFVAGSNSRLHGHELIKTTPPGDGSHLLFGIDDVRRNLRDFTADTDGIMLAEIGAPTSDDTALRCYHAKLASLELLLNHLIDDRDEYIVVDMTAGADAFATGLYDKFDLTLILVEPTRKSIQVFHQYADRADEYGVKVCAFGNKVRSDADVRFLETELGDRLIGSLADSDVIRDAERDGRAIPSFQPDQTGALTAIKRVLDTCVKDWDEYLAHTIELHKKFGGRTNEHHIDPRFVYPIRERMPAS